MAITKTPSKPPVAKKPAAPAATKPKAPAAKPAAAKSASPAAKGSTPAVPKDKVSLSSEAAQGPTGSEDKRATSITDALSKNWKTFDADGNGHLTESEIKKSLGGKDLSPDEKAALSSLRGRQGQMESASNDEWGVDNDGLTTKDIKTFENADSQDSKILREQFKIEQDLAREKPLDPSMKDKPADLSKLNGTRDFYLERYKDFRRRNPDSEAPKYYTDYGLKYFDRFHENKASMAPESQKWVDATGKALQTKMEAGRAKDPAAFAQLERSQEGFRKFAYDTHPDAYVESGLKNVPWADRVKVGLTPDVGDLANWSGVKQAVETGGRVLGQDAVSAGKGAAQMGKDFGNWVGSFF